LRATIYELARHKLQEQFGSEEAVDMRQLSRALEVAIQGVESFSRNEPIVPALPPPDSAQQRQRGLAGVTEASMAMDAGAAKPNFRSGTQPRDARFTAPWRFAVVIAIALLAILAVKERSQSIDAVRNAVARVVRSPAPTTPRQPQVASVKVTPTATAPAVKEPDPLTPTTYGIYAVSDNKLYELELLPGRVPDTRVAISAAITKPSTTTLPDGRIKFIVYRRDSATNAADRAEVRIIARIGQEMSFDKSGKPAVTKVDDSWVIRNISVPYRTAPKKDEPDMYEVLSENPETPLLPGRYALVLKGQAYDFTVGGTVTDPRQCLERFAATNGQFYSECQKPHGG
jgi:hypothetical protein